ncbi:MAG: ABC transporter substrate-binding protein [Clostridia bacterium]|nr:ABC transporter substrate-binding protein [Clostridia bacterium]
MKMMLAIVLALALATPAWASAESGEGPMTLTVGLTAPMTGNFFTNKWDTNMADVDLRELIHGNNTIAWEQNGRFALNQTVVHSLETQMDGGDKTYSFMLNENLAYCDGTLIAARDYVFSILLLSSPEFAALGGVPTELSYLKGYDDFVAGSPFSGVRITGEHSFNVTIDGRFLPHFYELMLLNVTPYPIGVIAPECAVADDGSGAYIDGPFTQELLRATILNEESGYLYAPAVTAGPYRLINFDEVDQIVRLAKNPYYTGNFEGVIPQVDELTVVYVSSADGLKQLEQGTLDLLCRVADGTMIEAGIEQAMMNRMDRAIYLRTGLAFISFACELEFTDSANLRKAITYLVDQYDLSTNFTLGFGMPVYGYYGMGQWMAEENPDLLEKYEKMLDHELAVSYLEADGWILNEDGDRYRMEIDTVRHRAAEDGSLERLALRWAQPEETALSKMLEDAMRPHMEAVGIELEVERMPFDMLLSLYYRQENRNYHMFNLSTDFSLVFDPFFAFHTGDEYQGLANRTGIMDEELMLRALAMRQTEAQNIEGYVEKWALFQDRFDELQPMVPLFSSVYADFYRTDLQMYYPSAYYSWATAIVYSYIGEPPAEDEVGEDEAWLALDDEGW